MPRRLLLFPDLYDELRSLRQMFASSGVRAVPTDVDLRKGDAYLVAAHAAIEFYLEDLCRRSLQKALWKYSLSGSTEPLLSAVVASHFGNEVGRLPSGNFDFRQGDDAVEKGLNWYLKRVNDNHGLRRSNILSLLLPLGFGEQDFDTIWLDSMDSFGGHRGDIAHGRPIQNLRRSPISVSRTGSPRQISVWSNQATRTRQRFTPAAVSGTISQLLPELRDWDRRLVAISK